MPPILIVAYGNPLRSDDGVAWRAADTLEGKFPEHNIEILRLHQLGPELAESITHFDSVIFLDAAFPTESTKPGEILIQPILPDANAADASRFSHVVTPQTVVTLASALYRANVNAQLVTITGENFDHGEALSKSVTAAFPSLISKIEQLVRANISNS